jgi:hypothetical protein
MDHPHRGRPRTSGRGMMDRMVTDHFAIAMTDPEGNEFDIS